MDACGAAVSYFVVGYAFSFGGAPDGSTETTFVGNTNFFLKDTEDYAFFAYNSAFAAATVTIVAGTLAGKLYGEWFLRGGSLVAGCCHCAVHTLSHQILYTHVHNYLHLAERCQMTAYFGYSILLAGWVWPIIVRAVWSNEGFLSAFHVDPLWGVGMVDFAGSGVVHVTGGLTALLAAIILGARRGRFDNEEGKELDEPKKIVGHSMALQVRDPLPCVH